MSVYSAKKRGWRYYFTLNGVRYTGAGFKTKTEAKAAATMKRSEYVISMSVGRGRGLGHYWTCDLGHEYVRINADYRT